MRNYLLNALKILIPIGIFAFLLWQVEPKDYRVFWNQPKRWELLALAQLLALVSILLSFFRWRILVHAFEIPFSYLEAVRLGFIGYLLNFVSFGSVGGDVFKAILVAKDRRDHRPEAVASVLLDRAIGLLGLVILATLGLFLASEQLPTLLIGIRNSAAAVAAISILALAGAIFLGNSYEVLIRQIERIPLAGEPLARMARAVRLLRNKPSRVLLLCSMAVLVHFLIACSVYLISCGVYPEHPDFSQHMQVVPPAMAAGTLPLAPGGIGYQEGALAGLFKLLPDLPENFSGILVATIYRLCTLVIAGIGLIYYLLSPVQMPDLGEQATGD